MFPNEERERCRTPAGTCEERSLERRPACRWNKYHSTGGTRRINSAAGGRRVRGGRPTLPPAHRLGFFATVLLRRPVQTPAAALHSAGRLQGRRPRGGGRDARPPAGGRTHKRMAAAAQAACGAAKDGDERGQGQGTTAQEGGWPVRNCIGVPRLQPPPAGRVDPSF